MIQFREQEISLDAIDAPAVPLRETIDPVYIAELADSIGSLGLLQPVGLRGPSPSGRYEVVWGDCRTRAMRVLQWLTAPARVCAWDTSPGDARAAENLHRQDLNPREEAREVKRLYDEGKPLAHVARTLRRSTTWCESRLELLKWPEEIQEQVALGELSMAAARLLAEIDYAPYRASLVDEARRNGASATVVQLWLAHYRADRDRIIRNSETVEQIIATRQEFRQYVECAGCGDEVDTRATSLPRLCVDCTGALASFKAEAVRERQQQGASRS